MLILTHSDCHTLHLFEKRVCLNVAKFTPSGFLLGVALLPLTGEHSLGSVGKIK